MIQSVCDQRFLTSYIKDIFAHCIQWTKLYVDCFLKLRVTTHFVSRGIYLNVEYT